MAEQAEAEVLEAYMAEVKAEAEAKVEPPMAEQAEAEVEAHMAEVKAEAPMAEATGMVLDNFIIDMPMAEAAITIPKYTDELYRLQASSSNSQGLGSAQKRKAPMPCVSEGSSLAKSMKTVNIE